MSRFFAAKVSYNANWSSTATDNTAVESTLAPACCTRQNSTAEYYLYRCVIDFFRIFILFLLLMSTFFTVWSLSTIETKRSNQYTLYAKKRFKTSKYYNHVAILQCRWTEWKIYKYTYNIYNKAYTFCCYVVYNYIQGGPKIWHTFCMHYNFTKYLPIPAER